MHLKFLQMRSHPCIPKLFKPSLHFPNPSPPTLSSLSTPPPPPPPLPPPNPTPTTFHLNTLLRSLSSDNLHEQALRLFAREAKCGARPDSYTLSSLLKSSASAPDLRAGTILHQLSVVTGLVSSVFVSNSLITMYTKCGRLQDAVAVFNTMPERDVVSWNSIASAFAMNGLGLDAEDKVREMVSIGLRPDASTVVTLLAMRNVAGCTIRELHCVVLRNGHECSGPKIGNALLSAYGKCSMVEEAHSVFDCLVCRDRVSWNAMIACCAQNGLTGESLRLLREMKTAGFKCDVVTYSGIVSSLSQNGRCDEAMAVFEEMPTVGLRPDAVAIASVLPAISGVLYLDYCREIHAYSYRHGVESDRRVRNALVSVYTKCGSVRHAETVFEAIRNRDVISWSSMIAGFTHNQYFVEALDTFREMVGAQIEPNPITVTSTLSACASLSALRLGKELHLLATKRSSDKQPFVGSALIDMYAKSGRIDDARRVFDMMKEKNTVTWNSMIGAYAAHGLGEESLELFRRMDEPDDVSFIAVLSACSHRGLVEEGLRIFSRMKDFGLSPREAHYACVVDLVGRAGRIEEALNMVKSMPVKASPETWGVLLGACRMHFNLEIAMFSGAQIIKSGSTNSGYYVMLSNVLAGFGRWGEVEAMRGVMKENGASKGAACSWIEVDKEVHSFVAKERAQHPEWESLLTLLSTLNEHIKGMWC